MPGATDIPSADCESIQIDALRIAYTVHRHGPLVPLRLTCASGETCVQTVSLRDGHRRLARRRGVLVTPGHPRTVVLRLSRAPRHGRLLVVVDFTDTFHGSFSPDTFFGGLVRLR